MKKEGGPDNTPYNTYDESIYCSISYEENKIP
jgi:hypothetical protein